MTLNRENFRKLIQSTREAHTATFNMETYASECGTPACVLGNYANRTDLQSEYRLDGRNIKDSEGLVTHFYDADVHDHFGITDDDAHDLFDVDGCGLKDRDTDEDGDYIGDPITRNQAVAYLEAFYANRCADEGCAP